MNNLDCSASGAKPALLMAIANISNPWAVYKVQGFFWITFLEAVSVLKISGSKKFGYQIISQSTIGKLVEVIRSHVLDFDKLADPCTICLINKI